MDKPGRNDACYCGSGEKYKKCHMKQDQAVEREQRAWREACKFVHRDLLSFARDDRFAEAFATALPLYWDELYDVETAEEMSMDEALRFFDWFAFDYPQEGGTRLIEIYKDEKRDDLSSHQQTVVDQWVEARPAGAYTLTRWDGQTLYLKDYMTGEEFEAWEAAGHGNVEVGEVILTRLLPVQDRLEFSTSAAYLPKDEVTDLAEKLAALKEADTAEHPDASHEDFLRRHNHIMIHHALAEAKAQGRPPVARLNPNRQDQAVQKMARQMKRFRRK